MAFEVAKSMLGEATVKQLLKYLRDDPEKHLVTLMKWGERLAIDPMHKQYAKQWGEMFADPDNHWRKLVVRGINQVDPKVLERTGINMFVNAGILSPERRRRGEEKYGVHVPWAVLIDPTGRCNLRCKGCWAAEYDRSQDMDYETLDRVITESEELGMNFIVVSGGEPLVRADDLISLAKKHNESVFHIFTNGTLITKERARQFAEAANMTFAISIEGFEEQTDARRGPGVFAKVMEAMDNLKEAGVPFGFSACYTRENTEIIASDEFIDLMIEKGCLLGWLFTYVPVGGEADLEYMATPEQRLHMLETVRRWRSEKPIFVADFWNDGPFVQGCIAGGRNYFHINAMGDVEPCAFVHYANVNIKNTSVVEALKCPLFQLYQENQPFNENHLRPCPIIDNPQKLEEIVEKAGAYSTQINKISAPSLCRPLYGYAEEWGEIADKVMQEEQI
ncbi:MAG TPA: radical SAM protein [Bacillota bacterium]|nr:radical SAM protein [Candidatus Fermentithermobacillaceae bacterium]HOB31059.1 radical SAM protein [Bacillota bacterium]HOK64896.1 radical SAM protein [Bacillota bacterium]HOL12443.1 radical SAM protein [Bacillota bacterium]HOQ03442.1 radical SAM protein [Bacillota bacterium]